MVDFKRWAIKHQKFFLKLGLAVLWLCVIITIAINFMINPGFDYVPLDKDFFVQGSPIPVPHKMDIDTLVWPSFERPQDDRIVLQMAYVSDFAKEYNATGEHMIILSVDGLQPDEPEGDQRFHDDKCPVRGCYLTSDMSYMNKADILIFKGGYAYLPPEYHRNPEQIFMIYNIESPLNTGDYGSSFQGSLTLNWTATYRSDSTIVTPYEKWLQFSNVSTLPKAPTRDYAAGKTKKVAWFVSNCYTENNRLEFGRELQKYIQVDIFGGCGEMACGRENENACFNMLKRDYKFYLSFENSNCQYYITEKLFVNALQNDVIPIVMGARKEDYFSVAPPGSYIHIEDFPNAKALADYLHLLDFDDTLYNDYFRWKNTGEFINTKFWCRVCAMLHNNDGTSRWYKDIGKWWSGKDVCTTGRWEKDSKQNRNDSSITKNNTSVIEKSLGNFNF